MPMNIFKKLNVTLYINVITLLSDAMKLSRLIDIIKNTLIYKNGINTFEIRFLRTCHNEFVYYLIYI